MIFKNFVWITPFLFFLVGYNITSYIIKTRQINVPNVIGKSLKDASIILSQNNLNLKILSIKENDVLPDSTILDQIPLNQTIKTNHCVQLIISKKKDEFKIPNLEGKNLKEIEKIFKQDNIKFKKYYLNSNLPKDICIAHEPNASKIINKNEKVLLYLSNGLKKLIIIPNFKNLSFTEIKNFLDLHNLHANLYTYNDLPLESDKNYIVIDQSPVSGTLIDLKNLQLSLRLKEV